MLTIGAKVIMPDLLRALENAQSQLPYAVARGLTATIKDVRDAEVDEMRKVFQAPTPFTLRSLYVRPATKARQEASTWLKDRTGPHYLVPQIAGGGRPLKRFEHRLVMHGYMRQNQRAVPAAGARLDAYGNMSKGQINQILSQLRTAVVQGDFSNATNSKRSRAKRAQQAYFVSQGSSARRFGFQGARGKGQTFEQHLPAGVWVRHYTSWGTAVKPVVLFVSGVRYNKRFDFFGVAERTVQRMLPLRMQAAVDEALRTARLSVQGGLF